MVPNLTDFGQSRQHLIEVTLPACAVLAGAEAFDLRPVQHTLDALPQPARRFGLGRPKGLQDIGDERCIDACNWEIAEYNLVSNESGRGPGKLSEKPQ
jgi:hypothetical protein